MKSTYHAFRWYRSPMDLLRGSSCSMFETLIYNETILNEYVNNRARLYHYTPIVVIPLE